MKKSFGIFAAAAMFASAIFSVNVATAAEPLRVCTASPGGNYDYVGKVLSSQLKGTMPVEVINTAGSWENLRKISANECDAAVVQSDALYLWDKENGSLGYFSVGELYTEFVHLLCGRKSKVEEFGDLNKSTKVFSGGNGSGADVTIRGLIRADAEFGGNAYGEVPLLNETNPDVALVKVKSGVADCLVYVGSRGNKFMSVNAQKLSNDLHLVPVKDKDFNDVEMTDKNGQEISVWEPTTMPSDTYDSIMPKGTLWGNSSLDTIGVTAMFIVSSNYVDRDPNGFAQLGLSINDVMNVVRADRGLELVD